MEELRSVHLNGTWGTCTDVARNFDFEGRQNGKNCDVFGDVCW